MADFYVLPEGCIANVLSFTGPADTCKLSLVSSIFRSAAASDAVWERFLPSDYQTIISHSSSSSTLRFSSKKELFLSLCHNPILIDEGKKSLSLDKWSGKKCYMISARDLVIVCRDNPAWGDITMHWEWTFVPEARFAEVAELKSARWLEVRGSINTSLLSPATLYTAFLVFKVTTGAYGFEYQPVEVAVGLVGSESCKQTVYLDVERGRRQQYLVPRRVGRFNRSRALGLQASVPAERKVQYPKERGDKWFEMELGDFYCEGGDEGELEMSVLEVKGDWKGGLIVQGIEIRPKGNK